MFRSVSLLVLAVTAASAATTDGTCTTPIETLTQDNGEQLRLLQAACANDAACAASMSCGGGLELTPGQLKIAPRAVAVAQKASPGAVCRSSGDPHVKSFVKNEDGNRMKYDFQMSGIFWLVYSDELKVQVRQCPWSLPRGTGARVKGNTAVAIQYMDEEVITIMGADDRQSMPTVTVAGVTLTADDRAKGIAGVSSGSMNFDKGGYTVDVRKTNGVFLNLVVAVPAGGVPWVNPGKSDEIDTAVMSGLCVSIPAAAHTDRQNPTPILVDSRMYGANTCAPDAWPPTPGPPPAIATPEPLEAGVPLRIKATPACADAGDGADDCVVDVLHTVDADPTVNWREEVVEPAITAKLVADVLIAKNEVAPPKEALALAPNAPPPTPGGACSSSGDPHFKSFTGEKFDFQMKGKYWLVHGPDLKVQVRQCPWSLPKTLSAGVQGNTAVAIQYKTGPIITILGGQNSHGSENLPSVCVTPAGATPNHDCTTGVVGDDVSAGVSGHDTGSITFEKDGYKVRISKGGRVFLNVNVAVPENGIPWEDAPMCDLLANTDATAECPKGCNSIPETVARTCRLDPNTDRCPDRPECTQTSTSQTGSAPVDVGGVQTCAAGFTLLGADCVKYVRACMGNIPIVPASCSGTAKPYNTVDTAGATAMLGLCVDRAAAQLADQWAGAPPVGNNNPAATAPVDILFDDRTYDDGSAPATCSGTATDTAQTCSTLPADAANCGAEAGCTLNAAAGTQLVCPQDNWPDVPPVPSPPPPPPPPAIPPEDPDVRPLAEPACKGAGDGAADCVTDVLFAIDADPDLKTSGEWRTEIALPAVKVALIHDAETFRVAPPLRSFTIAQSTKPPTWSCVRAEITLVLDIYEVAGTTGQSGFEKDFRKDVATALQIAESRVSIEKVRTASGSTNCVVAFNVKAGSGGIPLDTSVIVTSFRAARNIAGVQTIAGAENIGMVSCATLAAVPLYDAPDEEWTTWELLLLLICLLLGCCCAFSAAYIVGQSEGRNEAVNKSEFLDLIVSGDGIPDDLIHDKVEIEAARLKVQDGIDDHTRLLFEQMDADRSGSLSKEEIMTLVQAEGLMVEPSYVDGVIAAYDADQSGDLNLEEFAAMHSIIQRKAGVARLAARADTRLSRAVNVMEQKTGWDLDRDGDVGEAGRADTRVSKPWRDQLEEAKRRMPPSLATLGSRRQTDAAPPPLDYQAEEKREPPSLESLRTRSVPDGGGFGAVGLPEPQQPRSQTPERRAAPAQPLPSTDDRDPLGLGLGINQSGRSMRAIIPDADAADIEIGASVRGMASAFNEGVASGMSLSEMQRGESLRGSQLKIELAAPPRRAATPPRLTSPSVGI